MSDWDADSDDGAPSTSKPTTTSNSISASAAPSGGYGRRKFEDEDVEDQVKDDWEEDEEQEKPDVSSLQPLKKKGTVKQKIKEREEEERRRAALGLDSDEDDEDEEEDPGEKKKREKAAQIDADVANAANLLGVSKISQDDGLGSLKSAKPESKEDWEKFASDVYAAVVKSHSSATGYSKHFVPHLCKLLSGNLRDVDCRKQSTEWKKMADDKVKAEKEKKMGGGALKKKIEKPKAVGTASAKNTIDTRAYGDEALDDDLDFM